MHECSYLGHRIGSRGIRPEEVKMEAIKNMPIPMTKRDVSFLGIVGYYRRFVPHFATKAGPLTEATRNGKPEKVKWTSEEQNFPSNFHTANRCLRCRNWSSTQPMCTGPANCLLQQEVVRKRATILHCAKGMPCH